MSIIRKFIKKGDYSLLKVVFYVFKFSSVLLGVIDFFKLCEELEYMVCVVIEFGEDFDLKKVIEIFLYSENEWVKV